MMAQFSPFTRRVVALGILILVLIGLFDLVLAPVYALAANSLSGLEDARFRRARLEAIAARPPLPASEPVPASLYLVAPDRQRATDALLAAISSSAARYEVQLDSVAPLGADASRGEAIAVTLAARGEHDKILAWVNELERGAPAVHFADWSLAPDAGAPATPGAPPPAPPAASPDGDPPPPAAPVPTAPGAPVRLTFGATAVAVWEPE
jgi:type II secretory pathway component PulM